MTSPIPLDKRFFYIFLRQRNGHALRHCEERSSLVNEFEVWIASSFLLAMTRSGREVLRQNDTTYESNTKIPNPNNLRPMRDNGVLRQPDKADGTGASPL